MMVRLLVFVGVLAGFAAPAAADKAEILDLYKKADVQLADYQAQAAALLAHYKAEHSGKPYKTNWRNQSTASGLAGLEKAQSKLASAIEKQKNSAALLENTNDWIGKMRKAAYANLNAGRTALWSMYITTAAFDIAALHTAAPGVCQSAQKLAFDGEEPASAQDYYKNERKFVPIVARNVNKRIRRAEVKLKGLEYEYEVIGESFADARAALTRHAWRWLHYYEERGQTKRAQGVRMHIFKRFGYNNRVRPEFKGNSFYESDINWFISFPGSADRFHHNCGVRLYGQNKEYKFFHKLDRFVKAPVETYDDFGETLAPLQRRGTTPLERISWILSSRLTQFYRTQTQIEQQHAALAKVRAPVDAGLARYEALAALRKELKEIAPGFQSGGALSDQLAAVDAEIAELSAADNRLDTQIEERRAAIKAAEALRDDVMVSTDASGGYRALRPGESGTLNAAQEVARIEASIAVLEKNLAPLAEDLEDAFGARQGRLQQQVNRLEGLIAAKRQKIAQLNALRRPTAPPDTGNLIDLIDEQSRGRARLYMLREERDLLQSKLNANMSAAMDGTGASYTKLRPTYANEVAALKAHKPSLPDATRLDAQLPLASEDPALIREKLAAFDDVAGDTLGALAGQLKAQRKAMQTAYNELKRLNQRQKLLARDVALKRLQAANIVGFRLVGLGADKKDVVVEFMEESGKAIKQGQSILDSVAKAVETPGAAARDAAFDKLGADKASDVEKAVAESGNKVLEVLATAPDLPGQAYLNTLNEHIGNAKATVDSLAKIFDILNTGAALYDGATNDKPPTLERAFSYLKTINVAAEMIKDGLPIGGQAAGYYLDYMGKAISAIETEAKAIQKRVLEESLRVNLPTEVATPEQHLYTIADVKRYLGGLNPSEYARATEVLQARRVVRLLHARNLQQACERRLSSKSCIVRVEKGA